MKRVLLILNIALILCSCGRPDEKWHRMEGSIWNTLYSITYLSDRQLDDSIMTAMHRLELSVSAFNPQSTVSLINRNKSDLTDSIFELVFDRSQMVNRLSDGMFDPTVAPLVNYWGYGFDDAPEADLDSLMQLVGIADCRIDNHHFIKKHPATQLNFSAIAKGLGCDMVADALRRNGVKNYLIEIGGEIAAGGESPRGTDWHIQIDRPEDSIKPEHNRLTTIALTDCGVATSGNYRNFRDTAQGRTSHTINPLTGRPMTLDPSDTIVRSVTIVAPTAMLADALATASMLLTPSKAISMARRAGASRILIITDPDSLISVIF